MDRATRQLADMIRLLARRYFAVFGGGYMPPVEHIAEVAMKDVRGEQDELCRRRTCETILANLTHPTDLEFWSTPLGRTLIVAGAYPWESVPQVRVGEIVGVSRQRVGQWVRDGKVQSDRFSMVPREEVQRLLSTRLDELVKDE